MPKYQNHPDNELITFLREGDANAYTEIYNRYFRLMFVFAYKKLRDEEIAKDFVQELFTNLWYKRENVSVTGNFSSFLYTALRHNIINYFIHQKVENRYLSFINEYIVNTKNENADYLIRDKQLGLYIEKQIQNLPPKMRKIFELSRREFLSHREIAARLETSEYNVSKQITNALRILKTKLSAMFFFVF